MSVDDSLCFWLVVTRYSRRLRPLYCCCCCCCLLIIRTTIPYRTAFGALLLLLCFCCLVRWNSRLVGLLCCLGAWWYSIRDTICNVCFWRLCETLVTSWIYGWTCVNCKRSVRTIDAWHRSAPCNYRYARGTVLLCQRSGQKSKFIVFCA